MAQPELHSDVHTHIYIWPDTYFKFMKNSGQVEYNLYEIHSFVVSCNNKTY